MSRIFVNRVKEIEEIRDRIEKVDHCTILISGDSGVGKSSLLREIFNRYRKVDGYLVEFFDLAERPPHVISQALHMARSFGYENFRSFMEIVNKLDTGEYDTIQSTINEIENQVLARFIDDLRLVSLNKKIIRIIDSYDLKNLPFEEDIPDLNEYLKDLPSIIFIVAGQDVNIQHKKIMELFNLENILQISLETFTPEESADFFSELDKENRIPKLIRRKLYILTNGKPVLLALSADYVKEKVPLPEIIAKSEKELQEYGKSDGFVGKFESELVSRLRYLELDSLLYRLVLYMAQICRRMNAEIISILFNIDKKESDYLFSEIIDRPYVKPFFGNDFDGIFATECTLHDEMIRLVQTYAWDFIDVTGEERRILSQKVIDRYYLPKNSDYEKSNALISRAISIGPNESEWEQWLLESECLYYKFRIGENEGKIFYEEKHREARNRGLTNRKKILEHELQMYSLEMSRGSEGIAREIRQAYWIKDRNPVDARSICNTILKNPLSSPQDKIRCYNLLGHIEKDESRPISAMDYFSTSLNLALEINAHEIIAVQYNNIGLCSRTIGKFQEAMIYFEKAINVADASKLFDLSASIRNNLAATLRQVGRLGDADVLCLSALAELKKLKQEKPLAYAFLTKADIDRDKGSMQTALIYAKQALNIFIGLNDLSGQSQTYRSLSNIFRNMNNFVVARRNINNGLTLVGKDDVIRANLYYDLARTFRYEMNYLREYDVEDFKTQLDLHLEESFAALQNSVALFEKIGSVRDVARAKLELAAIKLMIPNLSAEDEIIGLLESVLVATNNLDDDFLKGYVYENRGLLLFKKMDYESAGKEFGKGACYIAKRSGKDVTRAFERLYRILLDPNLEPNASNLLVENIINTLVEYGEGVSDNENLMSLKLLCEHMLASPNI